MIQQMMMLMHLEMQLRHQALASYQEAQDADQRIRRLDDVMALNEQLNEVGSILSMLLNAPFQRGAAVGTEYPPAVHHNPSLTAGSRSVSPDGRLLLPRFHFHDTDSDDDDIDTSADEVTDVSYATSNVDDAIYDEEFGRAGSSSDSTGMNSYDFESSARISLGHAVSGENMSMGGRNAGGRPSVISGTGTDQWQVTATVPSSSTAFNVHSPVVLSRRRDRQSTPRRMTVEQPSVNVTVNLLHLPASVQFPNTLATTMPHTGTLPHVQSSAVRVAPESRTPLTRTGDHLRPAAAVRQVTELLSSAGVTGSTVSSSRQPERPSRNRFSTMLSAVHGNTSAGTSSHQTLPASSLIAHQVSSGDSDARSTSVDSASQQTIFAVNSSQPSAHSSTVLTEPWPILPMTEPHTSASVSTNRSAIAHPAARHEESQYSQTRGHLTRNNHPPAGVTHGPQRAVQQVPVNRPALPLRRSSVRNALGRPAGPASVSTLRPRMIPLPHPPVSSRRQSFGNQGTAGGRSQVSSDMLRSRRRSEIAHEIMFPPQNDSEQ